MNDNLIETREFGDYRIKIYYDIDSECPVTGWDLSAMFMFGYSQSYWRDRLSRNCNWGDLFSDDNHTVDEALTCLVVKYVKQKDIITYLKAGKVDNLRFVYNRSTRLWELQSCCSRDRSIWSTDFEVSPSDLRNYNYCDELLEDWDREDMLALLNAYAKDIVVEEWSSSGYSQGDWVEGFAYVTKELYDKRCGRTDIDWKEGARQCIEEDGKIIGMWMWGDVKGFVLEKKVYFTKHYKESERDNQDDYEWEHVDSCWGYYMETEELINEVISEHKLKEAS